MKRKPTSSPLLGLLLQSCVLLLPASALAEPLFQASADPRKLQSFRVEGLQSPVWGTVYPAGALEQGGMPLGGLGTGYLCVNPDGRFGKTSIFNRYPAPMVLNQPFLFLTVGDRQLVLATAKDGVGDLKAVHYFGHFPVADLRGELALPTPSSFSATPRRPWSTSITVGGPRAKRRPEPCSTPSSEALMRCRGRNPAG